MVKRKGALAVHTYAVGQRVRVVFNLNLRSLGPDAPHSRADDKGVIQAVRPDGRYLVGWRKSHAFVREAIELQPDYRDSFAPGDLVELDLPTGILPGIVVEMQEDTDWVLVWTELGRLPLIWCFAHELIPVQKMELTEEEWAPYARLHESFGAVRAAREAQQQGAEAGRQESDKQTIVRSKRSKRRFQ